MPAPAENLLKPIKIGQKELKNRVFMAPLTRVRADPNHLVTPMMVKYYSDRASAGLIIAEATMVKPGYSRFRYEPGIYSEEHIEAWKKVTDAVHSKGGVIFLQLYHGGRATIKANLAEGLDVVGPSAILIEGSKTPPHSSPTGQPHPYEMPREVTEAEIKEIVEIFVQGAKNAIAAGFDGVEVHGANGYLLDQFFRSSSNTRPAPYGGSIDNRCNFTIEVTEAVCKAIGSDRVGLRISPLNNVDGMNDDDPEALTKRLCTRLNDLNLAYLHVMRGHRWENVNMIAAEWAREAYKGTLISNLMYSVEEAEEAIATGKADAIAFGTAYIANSDLVERIALGAELNEARKEYFYSRNTGEVGYNDYPLLSDTKTAAAAN